jgi:RNA polymerase sigma-70 factor (ECF subfamily)
VRDASDGFSNKSGESSFKEDFTGILFHKRPLNLSKRLSSFAILGGDPLKFIEHIKGAVTDSRDLETLNRYLLPHAPVIYRFGYRLCGNAPDTEDLVQETFYFAIKNFHQLKDLEKCKYWLFSILRNLFLKDYEKRKIRGEIAFDIVCESLHQGKGPESDFLKAEIRKNLQALLDGLDEKLRFPIRMFYFEGHSYKEISEQLNIPIGTVMSRIARAKTYLKRDLLQSDKFQDELENRSDEVEPL